MGRVKNGCGQSGLWTQFECISRMNQMDVTGFLHAGTNSHKLKGDGESDDGALKLPVFKE